MVYNLQDLIFLLHMIQMKLKESQYNLAPCHTDQSGNVFPLHLPSHQVGVNHSIKYVHALFADYNRSWCFRAVDLTWCLNKCILNHKQQCLLPLRWQQEIMGKTPETININLSQCIFLQEVPHLMIKDPPLLELGRPFLPFVGTPEIYIGRQTLVFWLLFFQYCLQCST